MKQELRKAILEIRRKLPTKEVFEKSDSIKNKLFEMKEFKGADSILFYVSYDNEVFTHDMIKECLSNGKDVIVPISNKENKNLILSKLNEWNDLNIGSYGILEPRVDKIKNISIDEIDMVVVPGVGFDEKGRRIGHGKGYYDNLLRNSKKAFHIGLAFEFQIVERIPAEKHDIPVDKIVTEKRIIPCSNKLRV
jgi:5-formyltetrahydrofolate cyclo-ligase